MRRTARQLRNELTSGLSQFQTARMATEQLLIKVIFQQFNLLADRRRRDVQFFGRRLEATTAGRRFKRAQGIQGWQAVVHTNMEIEKLTLTLNKYRLLSNIY